MVCSDTRVGVGKSVVRVCVGHGVMILFCRQSVRRLVQSLPATTTQGGSEDVVDRSRFTRSYTSVGRT